MKAKANTQLSVQRQATELVYILLYHIYHIPIWIIEAIRKRGARGTNHRVLTTTRLVRVGNSYVITR